ncbi:MAG: hypothetical protein ACFBSE_16730 [Prochloraceae cyanobacterium]
MKLKFKVEKVICQKDFVLIIFYTAAHCWQFCCLDRTGSVYKSSKVFYTPRAAEVEGRSYADQNLLF